MTQQDLLIEIGCEELPPSQQQSVAQALCQRLTTELERQQIAFKTTEVFSTPRRLAVIIGGVAEKQPAQTIEREGPLTQVAFDKEGIPTLAGMGFIKSCGISLDELKTRSTKKGERIYCEISEPGKQTISLLPDIIQKAVGQLPLKKPMRWADFDFSFIRPVHWVCALFGSEVIELSLFNVSSRQKSRGHRFMAPAPFTVEHPKQYEELLKEHYVVAHFEQRKKQIAQQIEKVVPEKSTAVFAEGLLDEVTALCEWPVVLVGQFDPRFLALPREVLITSLQSHQRCFAIENQQGDLLPCFILVSNITSTQPELIVRGNERVVNARLADADFFYNNDVKQTLASQTKRQESIVFQKGLGSLADKSKRLVKLVGQLAKKANVPTETVKTAASLCKSDLLTEMVGEFPELQGVMGYYYALNDGLPAEVATAIREQYDPKQAGAALPLSEAGTLLALSDRLDSLVGIIGIGNKPKGDKDPFALRRAALGVARILSTCDFSFSLNYLLKTAINGYKEGLKEAADDLIDYCSHFILERLKAHLIDEGAQADEWEAVSTVGSDHLKDLRVRLLAVQHFKTLAACDSLASSNKRVLNILKKNGVDTACKVKPSLLSEQEEKALYEKIQALTPQLSALINEKNYAAYFVELTAFKPFIDAFFEKVMIMSDDEKVKNNRIALLWALKELFCQVANISVLQPKTV